MITGTLINYYFHCERQCYLHAHRINLEDNSEDVKIGKALHETKFDDEIKFENISLDKISDKFVTEFKKSDADETAAKFQLLFYLKILKDSGIVRDGILKFGENKKSPNKTVRISLNSQTESELNKAINSINNLIYSPSPPLAKKEPKCNKCAYYAYCFI